MSVADVASARVELRRLVPADAALYRAIRLAGLEQEAWAFGSTFAAENFRPLSWFADRLDDADGSAVFGAFGDGNIVGVAGFYIQQGQKRAHKGMLWGMYVRPDSRRAGIGRRLVEAVIDHAGGQVEIVQLTVVADNARARQLYTGLGFIEYGIEKNALKEDGRYCDEVLMARPLTTSSDR